MSVLLPASCLRNRHPGRHRSLFLFSSRYDASCLIPIPAPSAWSRRRCTYDVFRTYRSLPTCISQDKALRTPFAAPGTLPTPNPIFFQNGERGTSLYISPSTGGVRTRLFFVRSNDSHTKLHLHRRVLSVLSCNMHEAGPFLFFLLHPSLAWLVVWIARWGLTPLAAAWGGSFFSSFLQVSIWVF